MSITRKGVAAAEGKRGRLFTSVFIIQCRPEKTTHVVTSGFKIYFHLYYNESIVNAAFIGVLCHVFKHHILSKVT